MRKKILKCQCLGNVVTAKCKIQRDKRAPLSIVTVRIVKIETEGITNGNIFTEYSEHFPLHRSTSSFLNIFPLQLWRCIRWMQNIFFCAKMQKTSLKKSTRISKKNWIRCHFLYVVYLMHAGSQLLQIFQCVRQSRHEFRDRMNEYSLISLLLCAVPIPVPFRQREDGTS